MPLKIIDSHRVAVFDVDGLLIDSERAYNAYWQKAGRELGYPISFEMALELRSLDASLAQKMFLNWFGDADAYQRVRMRRREMMRQEDESIQYPLKSGAKEMISFARERGLRTAIVTSSQPQKARSLLDRYSLAEMFDHIVCAEKVERNKPFPDIYLYAAAQLGVKPEECIAFEDSPNGLRSAHDAGCYTVMIPDLSPYSKELDSIADDHAESLLAYYEECRREESISH